MRFLKIYDKDMNLLDEIHDFTDLEYSKTINDINTLTFNIPLTSPNATPSNLEFMNKIEYVEVKIKNRQEIIDIIWEGIIVDRTFDSANISIGCYSRLFLLSKRRLKNDQSFKTTIDTIIKEILKNANSNCKTDSDFLSTLIAGNFDSTKLEAEREVKNTDMALDLILDLVEDKGCYVDVKGDKLNFYENYGTDKSNYRLQYTIDGAGDNLLKLPTLNQTIIDASNSVFGRVDWEEEEKVGNEQISTPKTISDTREDLNSIGLYGRLEGAVDIHQNTRKMATLRESLNKELNARKFATNSIDVECIDSWLCPMSDINLGDKVTLALEPYFGFEVSVKILKIEYIDNKKTYKLTLGNTLFKQQKPTYNVYAKDNVLNTI